MGKWVKTSTMVVLLIVMATMILGCSKSSNDVASSTGEEEITEKPVTIRFATNFIGSHPLTPIIDDIVTQFEEDYPNVTVEIEGAAGDDHQTKIQLDAQGDRLPDVFDYWRLDPSFGLNVIQEAGMLADLTEWTKTDPFFEDLFDESSWKTATKDEKVYGIPAQMYYIQFLANKEVFDRAGVSIPQTWDELLSAIKQLKEEGELPWGININGDSNGSRIYNYVFNRMIGNERALNMYAGKEPINVPEVIKASELVQELIVGNAPEDALAIERDATYAKYINNGRAALMMDGSWGTAHIDSAIQESLIPLDFPLIPGGAQQEMNVERDLTKLYYISATAFKDTDKQPYVKELVKRLTSRESAKKYIEDAKQPMPMLGVEIDPQKVGQLTVDAQNIALNRPMNKWIPSMLSPDQRKKYESLQGELLSGKLKPDIYVQKLDEIINSN
ncbi:ABC transporter substrate-binding protein [Halalkalibacter kiskunsagensis]|uniref:ABC transporter substrate-binding protein n=1 Tax=Halalkalibacter kiskunsagensis TaxID=1548599 RepID=A0ABV6KBJ9_9BACI